jgi:hypothetical protein
MTRSSRQALAKHSPLRRVGLELLLASILLNVFSLVMPLTVLQVTIGSCPATPPRPWG